MTSIPKISLATLRAVRTWHRHSADHVEIANCGRRFASESSDSAWKISVVAAGQPFASADFRFSTWTSVENGATVTRRPGVASAADVGIKVSAEVATNTNPSSRDK